jgi:hypothetical protein
MQRRQKNTKKNWPWLSRTRHSLFFSFYKEWILLFVMTIIFDTFDTSMSGSRWSGRKIFSMTDSVGHPCLLCIGTIKIWPLVMKFYQGTFENSSSFLYHYGITPLEDGTETYLVQLFSTLKKNLGQKPRVHSSLNFPWTIQICEKIFDRMTIDVDIDIDIEGRLQNLVRAILQFLMCWFQKSRRNFEAGLWSRNIRWTKKWADEIGGGKFLFICWKKLNFFCDSQGPVKWMMKNIYIIFFYY